MIKVSLFAEAEREARLDEIGDALSKLATHVDCAALDAQVDEAAPRPGRERGARDVWADKGYVDGQRKQRLDGQGWRLHIQRKGVAGKPLSE